MDESVDKAPPIAAAVVVAPEPPNPVHNVLQICEIIFVAIRNTFINIWRTYLDWDFDVTHWIVKANGIKINCCHWKGNSWNYADQEAPSPCLLGQRPWKARIEPEMWTVGEMNAAVERKESELNYGKIDVDIIDPGKGQTNVGWDNWQIVFGNKLSATLGAAAKVPIDYVVRPDIDEHDEVFQDDDEESGIRCR